MYNLEVLNIYRVVKMLDVEAKLFSGGIKIDQCLGMQHLLSLQSWSLGNSGQKPLFFNCCFHYVEMIFRNDTLTKGRYNRLLPEVL